jgi:Uma2 family endonuclease
VSLAAAETPLADRFAVPPEPVLPLSVPQYHAMIRAGILKSGAPLELLEGWLVKKMIKSPRHRVATRKARLALEEVLPDGWSVDVQEAITTGDSEPEPDVSVVRGDTSLLLDRHPAPDEVGLLIEVADTSLERDRNWKKCLYARAGIGAYWIVNLGDRQIEVFRAPSGSGDEAVYASREVFRPGQAVPVWLDDEVVAEVAVDAILP